MNKKFIMVAICSIAGILLICGCMQTSKNTKDSQKGSELEAVDTMHILQVGEKAFDAELFDMQGNKHRLFEAFADGRYVLLDFWNLHCGACRQSESELLDSISEWQGHEWSKKIVWKNWNDGKKFKKGGIKSRYYDFNAVPFYVLLSPDGRILGEMTGYGVGYFLGMAEALNGPRQDNFNNPNLVIRKVKTDVSGTTISFRYFTEKGYWFNIARDSYLTANGRKYKLTAADGIKLDENNTPQTKAYSVRVKYGIDINYCDFALTFEPLRLAMVRMSLSSAMCL